MKRIIAAALLATAVVIALGCHRSSTGSDDRNVDPSDTIINWVGTEMIFTATEIERPPHSLVYFYTNWCGYCKRFNDSTLHDPGVVGVINSGYNIARVNPEIDSQLVYFDSRISCDSLAHLCRVQGFPEVFVFDSQGQIIGAILGAYRPSGFLQVLDSIVTHAH